MLFFRVVLLVCCLYLVVSLGLRGKSPEPLGSIRVSSKSVPLDEKIKNLYGGKGDKPHLGGWTEYDPMGVSNHTWDYMMGVLGVRSVLDIGCGRGISANYFHNSGARVKCIEGSMDAIEHSFLPSRDLIVNHDFTRGPYWPDETYDACWSVEVLEHISRQYTSNWSVCFDICNCQRVGWTSPC